MNNGRNIVKADLSEFKLALQKTVADFMPSSSEDDKKFTAFEPYTRKINNIIAHVRTDYAVWEFMHSLVNEMPGFWSFWDDVRPLTLQLEKLLNRYPQRELKNTDDFANENHLQSLNTTIVNLNHEMSVLKQRLAKVRPSDIALADRCILREEEIKRLAEELQTIFTEKQQLQQENKLLLAENAKLKTALDKLIANYKQLDADYYHLKKSFDKLERAYEETPIKTEADLKELMASLHNTMEQRLARQKAEIHVFYTQEISKMKASGQLSQQASSSPNPHAILVPQAAKLSVSKMGVTPRVDTVGFTRN